VTIVTLCKNEKISHFIFILDMQQFSNLSLHICLTCVLSTLQSCMLICYNGIRFFFLKDLFIIDITLQQQTHILYHMYLHISFFSCCSIPCQVKRLVFAVSPHLLTSNEGVKGKTGCLGIRIMCPNESTCLLADCCFSVLAIKEIQLTMSVEYNADIIVLSLKCNFFSPSYSWIICSLDVEH